MRHRNRKKSIGGYGAASILGCNQYMSAMRVAMELLGEMAHEDISASEPVEWGLRSERIILQKYQEIKGCRLAHKQKVFRHPKYKYLAATPDGIVFDIIVDAKNLNYFAEKEWAEAIPELYIVQLHYYAAIIRACGILLKTIEFCVLFGGQHFKIFTIPIDDELCDIIISRCVDFYTRYIINREPLDMYRAPSELLSAYYRKENGMEVILNPGHEAGQALMNYISLKNQIKDLEVKENDSKAIVQAAMAEASRAIYQDSGNLYGASWVSQKGRDGIDLGMLKEKYPEVYADVLKEGQPYRVFRATVKTRAEIEYQKTKKLRG